MNAPLELVLILHLRLPTGSTRAEADSAWENCFQPIIGALYHTPNVRVGIVLAEEIVLDLEEHHPEGLEWLRSLLERGQIEMVGTALYEPVLSALPEQDAAGQITAHANQIRKVFGVRPTGFWVPHGVWEPTFPRVLAETGMKWTVIPDRHLEAVGAPRGEVSGVYHTEREGHCIALLPLDTRVQEAAADVPVKEVLSHLRFRANMGQSLLALGLEGSRFGQHPSSSVRKDQSWFATLIAAIARAHRSVDTLLPSQAVALGTRQGRVYVPSQSPKGVDLPWEKHLVRYESANRLHKKMVRVSRLVQKVERYLKEAEGGRRPDPGTVLQAQRYLYRAQTSPPYWHGEHAGVYDPSLRALAWKDVLRAERLAMEGLRAADRLIVERNDLDCDGVDEVLLRTPAMSMVVNPAQGAAITELALVDKAHNFADVHGRTMEPYHEAVLLEEWDEVPTHALDGPSAEELVADLDSEMREQLYVDDLTRGLFRERFLGPDDAVEMMRRGTYTEHGAGFSKGLWEVIGAERHGTDAVRTVLNCDGTLRDPAGTRRLRAQKRFTLRHNAVGFRYELTNRSTDRVTGRLALQLDLFLGVDPTTQRLVGDSAQWPIETVGQLGRLERIRARGGKVGLEVVLLYPAEVWCYPVRSVHRHLGSWQSNLQGVCLLLVTDVALDPGTPARFDVKLKVES